MIREVFIIRDVVNLGFHKDNEAQWMKRLQKALRNTDSGDE
jgi:hypothetical protein